jgi:hypothetical protein
LTAIPGSARSLGLATRHTAKLPDVARAGRFTPDEKQLLVTTKASTSSIDVFQVGRTGCSPRRLFRTRRRRRSRSPYLAGNLLVAGEAGASSMTTYRISGIGSLSDPKSAATARRALLDQARRERLLRLPNTATSNLSSFSLGRNGQPILLSAVAATDPTRGPIDLATSGRFLYARDRPERHR